MQPDPWQRASASWVDHWTLFSSTGLMTMSQCRRTAVLHVDVELTRVTILWIAHDSTSFASLSHGHMDVSLCCITALPQALVNNSDA